MLHEFLDKYKKEILQLCREKVLTDGDSKPTTPLLEKGLPIFFDELIGVLQRTAATAAHATDSNAIRIENTVTGGDAAAHGKESLRLGYSISQVVHSYGAVCQSIAEYVHSKGSEITTREFQDLNLSLDCAIAEAVTEFEKVQNQKIADNEVERLGFLMHEMRNILSSASAAHQMIQKGNVGGAGITSQELSRSFERMQRLIEAAEAEIRFRGKTAVERTQMNLINVITDVYDAAVITGKSKEIRFKLDVDPAIQLTADRHLIYSALSNLVNNAMKFTKNKGHVSVRGKESGERILIEVEDECGGLLEGKTEELFNPFLQNRSDKTGMGLGLSLSRKAIELNQGKLTARNIPEKGCVFTISLPKDTGSKR